MNRKFYIEYYFAGNLSRQRIRTWAIEHQNIFPEFSFTNTQSDHPTTHAIANKLERFYGFTRVEEPTEVILRNTNTNFRF
jgi:hypothetical protein